MNMNMITYEHYLFTITVFLSISAFISSDTIKTGASSYADGFVAQDEEISDEEDDKLPVEPAANMGHISISLKAPEECYTPDNQIGHCIEIKKCPLLLEQLQNPKALKFLQESKCGTENDDITNPHVCCDANFKKQLKDEDPRSISLNSTLKEKVEHNKILPENCGLQNINLKDRIFGGKEAALGEFPWMARLLHMNENGEKQFGCSGFLIHYKYVLTAGHCTHKKFLVNRGPVISVVLGEHDIRTETDCVEGICAPPLNIRKVTEVIIHPNYDPEHENAHYNDITLIRLIKEAKRSEYVKPICLNRDPAYNPKEYVLSGWGKTETEIVSSVKMKVSLPSVNRSDCDDLYSILNVRLKDTQICAGGEEGKDSCNGDSGGPLMFFGENNIWFAAGIVSFGLECGVEGWPGVYTNIAYFVPWIQNTIYDTQTKSQSNFKVSEKFSL